MDNGSSWNIGLFDRCGLGIIGVSAGEGMGVGSSWMGDRHLLTPLDGISRRIVGGCSKFDVEEEADDVPLPGDDLCAFNASNTGTSIVVCL